MPHQSIIKESVPLAVRQLLRGLIERFGYSVVRTGHTRAHPRIPDRSTNLDDYRHLTSRIPGMVSTETADLLYALCVSQTIRGDVVEIGSWQGKSTSYLGRAVKDSGNGQLYAVDHFRGNPGRESSYRIDRADLSDLPARFTSNMKALELDDVVTLVREASAVAHAALSDRALRLLFIDGDHSEVGVSEDIRLFAPQVVQGGLVLFDDYDETFPGLVAAVQRWLLERAPTRVFWRNGLLVCQL